MIKDFIITSEQRVGSRWIHYLLADLYSVRPSPEIDVAQLFEGKAEERVLDYFASNQIPKFHRATHLDLFAFIDPSLYKVIAVVRNPRDRAVSLAFHNRYHPKHHFEEKDCATDEDAIKNVIYSSGFVQSNYRQFIMMPSGFSTKAYQIAEERERWENQPYLWTTYKWLKENTAREISTMISFLKSTPAKAVNTIVAAHSFQNKSKRKAGEEKRSDVWRRKGIENDWENWFDSDMMRHTELLDQYYWMILENE
jgi:hypothetical protein